jgi:NAD-dependent protein deacetylase/lipoamidase
MSSERLAELIHDNQPCVVLSGAGVSTESGIPDFRSPGGIWAQYDPSEYATIHAFLAEPAKVWEFYKLRFAMLKDARPNAAHEALAELERSGHVEAIVTQNIDRLHGLAGSQNVVEVHGSIATCSCLDCGRRVPFDEVLAIVESAPAPACPDCGSILKPDVVMFGELLPVAAIARATELARSARLLLVVGSSLAVFPVGDLPQETLDAGGRLAIVNREPTAFDDEAALVVHAGAGETLDAVRRQLLK